MTALAFMTLALGVAWWRRAGWHWAIIAGVAGVVAVLVAHVVDVPSAVGSTYPRSFLVWGALPVFAAGAAIWQWPRVTWWRRVVAFTAVPLLVAFAGLQIDAHYGYLPTVGDLLGRPLPGQVTANAFERSPLRLARLGPHHPHAGHAALDSPGPRVGIPSQAYTIGLVAKVGIPGTVSHFAARAGYVWVPPYYFTHPYTQLPVLMLLTGTPSDTSDWLRGGGALGVASAYAQAHGGFAPMMVFPDSNGGTMADTECVDGPRGNAETYLTVDVPAFMHAHFDAPVDPQQWAVGGLSEGGTCALDLVTQHPSRFHTFADFSGDRHPNTGNAAATVRTIFGGSYAAARAHDAVGWFRRDSRRRVAGFFAVGVHDHKHVVAEEQLAALARISGLPVAFDLIPGGGHDFPTWHRALTDAFGWIVGHLHPAAAATGSHQV